MNKCKLLLIPIVLITLGGCASAVKRHEVVSVQLNQGINCSTAKQDIAALKLEKTTATEKLANGIASVLPTSVIFNLIVGEFSSRKAIATGEFDQMLYMKIDAIEKQCFMMAKTDG